MKSRTIKQDELCAITHRTVGVVRHMQAHDYTPWDDSQFPEGKHRRYDGYHALCLIIAEMLQSQNVQAKGASEFVLFQRSAVEQFLDEVEQGKHGEPLFVASVYQAVEDSWTGARWVPTVFWGTGTAEDLVSIFRSKLNQIGRVIETRKGQSTERVIGGPYVAVAPIAEAYRILKIRAEEAGFVIDGRKIFKLAEIEEETDE